MSDVDRPGNDPTGARWLGAALCIHGLVAATVWWATRAYAVENGGAWLTNIAVAVGIAYVGAGALIWITGNRWRRAVRNYLLVVVLAAFVAPYVSGPGIVPALTIVCGLSLLLAAWGRPGKIRMGTGLAALSLGTLVMVIGAARQLARPPLTGPPVVFEVMQVDDELDPLTDVGPLPGGWSVETETINGQVRRFLRVTAPSNSAIAATRQEASQWLNRHVRLPSGVRVGWERETDQTRVVIRTFWLHEPAFLTSADVEDTSVLNDKETGNPNLLLTLNPPAATRLQETTRQHIGQRLAILLDGVVEVAPLVRSEIAGGHVTVTLGKEWTRDEAAALAAGLRGELLHGP